MNDLSNSLLSLLLGWLRGIFSSLLKIVQGSGVSFLSWMSRRWFILAGVLVIAGLTVDALIYLLRWRPQYVWRSRLYRLFHRRDSLLDETQFSQGYETGLQDFNFADTPIPGLNEQEDPGQEVYDLYLSEQQPYAAAAEEEALPVEERRRRSDRHNRRALRLSGRFHLPDLSETGQHSAYPEPPIDVRSAFHQPVYPATDLSDQAQGEDEGFPV